MREVKFQVRTTQEQVELWRRAALLRGVSLSEWLRQVLDATARETVRRGGRGDG